jgi:hypothetical protein
MTRELRVLILHREIIGYIAAFVVLPACWWGIGLIRSGRRFLGITILVLDYGFFCGSIALVALTQFSWTWGWWI